MDIWAIILVVICILFGMFMFAGHTWEACRSIERNERATFIVNTMCAFTWMALMLKLILNL